jgi:hypothetical protein
MEKKTNSFFENKNPVATPGAKHHKDFNNLSVSL